MLHILRKTKLAKTIDDAKAYLASTYKEEPKIRYSLSDTYFEDRADSYIDRILRSGNYSDLHGLLDNARNLTFVEKVNAYIQERKIRETAIYKAAQMDRRLFSKVMADPQYKPSKDTALAMAYALRLNTDEAKDLLERAGYSFSHSNQRDIIMEYFFREGIFDLNKINYILSELQMKCIGR
ncbi:MAG: hypothetical protein IJK28_09555 [Clostridia bacterium]|nr:hypothetical protein [Clostridia bacterium]